MTTLRPAARADIPFIMAVERRPGNDAFVNRWSDDAHQAALASPDNAYFIGEGDEGQPVGFAIVQDRQDANGNLYVLRLAVAVLGEGHGRQIFAATRDWVFRETTAHRLWLRVYRHNSTAYALYRSCGFVEEGVAREARLLPDGSRVDVVMMSQLRREWQSLQDAKAALTAASA
ncbi:GNAT family N-acetyltransferase [Acidisoma cellulosilytica]|uniref:GNAT family N-acetyltransferase n=1 Tax=Acidisoma cellulosilyticum TaxID=2802395 RepID=A0A964E4Z5_9PROT|nr:GNAT family protein [Acidisoma cellulosilyticum]MCB8881969.1 GNAT family N-acetyltransferase [Acidisoma cellulosilyticum]